MLTGRFDPIAQGETWVWDHTIIADDTGDLMNLDGCTFALTIGCPDVIVLDYGRAFGLAGFFCLACGLDGLDTPIASLATGAGILTAQEGTILATVPGAATLSWPAGDNRLTLDVTRNGETVRLVEMTLPVLGN